MKRKVKLKFIKISGSTAKDKVESLNDILTRVYLRMKDKNISLDRSEKNMVCTGQNLKRKNNE